MFLKCVVAGMQYRPLSQNQRDAIKDGDALVLKREPKNTHDRNAVAIFHGDVMIGYIPRAFNKELAKALDEGFEFEAVVDDAHAFGDTVTLTVCEANNVG